jgi:hypothetical protein
MSLASVPNRLDETIVPLELPAELDQEAAALSG